MKRPSVVKHLVILAKNCNKQIVQILKIFFSSNVYKAIEKLNPKKFFQNNLVFLTNLGCSLKCSNGPFHPKLGHKVRIIDLTYPR